VLGLTKKHEELIRVSRSHGTALRIMEFAQRPEGATVEDFLDGLKLKAASFHPRLYELLRTGCIYVDGRRRTKTGHKARVYRTAQDATFARYLELRKITYAKKVTRSDLTETERAVLAIGMKTLEAWHSTENARRSALIRFVDRMNALIKAETLTKKK